jgi:hypothetical protein
VDWFRTYSAMVHKPKVVNLTAEAIGYWTMFACVANQWSPRGSLPDDIEELAIIIHRPVETVGNMIEVLIDSGLLERRANGSVWFYKWETYQPPSTERANKSKGLQHPATSGNKSQPQKRREEKREEEKEAPLPPTGGERAGLTSEDPETLSVCRWANDLVTGWGPLAEGACQTYPPAWVREACSIAREAKASRWKFVDSILGRFKSQGGPDSARAPTTPRNTIAEKLGGGTLAERKARTKAIFEDLDRRNGVA